VGVVVKEALERVEVTGLSLGDRVETRLYGDGWVGGWPVGTLPKKFSVYFELFFALVEKPKCWRAT
jgi:hypothetical protein